MFQNLFLLRGFLGIRGETQHVSLGKCISFPFQDPTKTYGSKIMFVLTCQILGSSSRIRVTFLRPNGSPGPVHQQMCENACPRRAASRPHVGGAPPQPAPRPKAGMVFPSQVDLHLSRCLDRKIRLTGVLFGSEPRGAGVNVRQISGGLPRSPPALKAYQRLRDMFPCSWGNFQQSHLPSPALRWKGHAASFSCD